MTYDKIVDSAVLDSIFTDIADAIREKAGITERIVHTEMATVIKAISGGSGLYAWKKTASDGTFIEYVTDNDKNAYPVNGSIHSDGYVYEPVGGWQGPWPGITWADGTDEEIVAMVAAADAGEINLADYWSVGDTRSVNLSAMAATGVGESHEAQTVEFTLMHAGGYELADGSGEVNFIVGMKNCLNEKGYMNSTHTNSGAWNGSARRVWCNSVFYNAVPSSLRGIFKQFKTVGASVYNGTTNQTSVDYFTLPATKEVFGGATAASPGSGTWYTNLTEYNALFQYDWYKTTEDNKFKTVNGAVDNWWTRSLGWSRDEYFGVISGINGNGMAHGAGYNCGLSPVGCI